MFKVKDRNTRKRCEISSSSTMKTPERCHWRISGVFIVNFEHILNLVLVFLLLTLSRQIQAGSVSFLFREHAPSIIFMDEIDSIGSTRIDSGGSGGGKIICRDSCSKVM